MFLSVWGYPLPKFTGYPPPTIRAPPPKTPALRAPHTLFVISIRVHSTTSDHSPRKYYRAAAASAHACEFHVLRGGARAKRDLMRRGCPVAEKDARVGTRCCARVFTSEIVVLKYQVSGFKFRNCSREVVYFEIPN